MNQHYDRGSVLLLQVPRINDKKIDAAEQVLASLHGLLVQPPSNFFGRAVYHRVSFEIAVLRQQIGFYIWVPRHLKEYVRTQLYAQYPTVLISEIADYAHMRQPVAVQLSATLDFTGQQALPIKTFSNFEVDPLAAITATLAELMSDEEAWVQVVLCPVSPKWQYRYQRYITHLLRGQQEPIAYFIRTLYSHGIQSEPHRLTEVQKLQLRAAVLKNQKLAYQATIRIVYRGNVQLERARLRLRSIVASYRQFTINNCNSLEQSKVVFGPPDEYVQRSLNRKHIIINTEEAASLYHLPHTVVETPGILWAPFRTVEPPANLSCIYKKNDSAIHPIATTNFRGTYHKFGVPRTDRGRHVYIIGQTGTGKSGLLELLAAADVADGYGLAVIDPHGDYARNMLQQIPAHRAHEVVYFDAADTQYPHGFNPLELHDPTLKTQLCSELMSVLKRLFDSWGPRLEYILRFTILALLDYPAATMLDITHMLTDIQFRRRIVGHVQDSVVCKFWQGEFARWNEKFANEAVAPVLNKVGAFTTNSLMRNIICQPKSSFDIRQIMDARKILIVNLSKGRIGEDNASLLGSLLVAKIQMAAMSRANIPAAEREPFYLYVDEFQNFTTNSFASILSEARKYGLNLTIANQYMAQMLPSVRDAILGNVGSIAGFRMSIDDARAMEHYFGSAFTTYDMVHMYNRHFIMSMMINGQKVPAFSAITAELSRPLTDMSEHIINCNQATLGTNVSRPPIGCTKRKRRHSKKT